MSAPLKAPRNAFPIVRAAVAEFRELYGAGIDLTYAAEGGLEIGERGPEGVPLTPPAPKVAA